MQSIYTLEIPQVARLPRERIEQWRRCRYFLEGPRQWRRREQTLAVGIAFRGQTYRCGLVLLCGQLKQHATECNGSLRPASAKTRRKRDQTRQYAEARRRFLANQASNFRKQPFTIVCQNCENRRTSCTFDADLKGNKTSLPKRLSALLRCITRPWMLVPRRRRLFYLITV
eukprot:s553_g6.t1